MKRKLLAVAVSLTMALTMAACGSTEEVPVGNMDVSTSVENSEASISGDATITPTPAPTVEPTMQPTEAPHEHNYVATIIEESTCTKSGTTKYTCECGDTYEEHPNMLEHQINENEWIYNNDATYEANGTEYASCLICGNVVSVREAEGTKLVAPTPEPTPIPEGLDTSIGDNLSFDGTITSPNGATLNKLASFNEAGLYNPKMEFVDNYEWLGYYNNNDPNDLQALAIKDGWYDNMDAMCYALWGTNDRSQMGETYFYWNDLISFKYGAYGGVGDFELERHPELGYYTMSINFDMSQNVVKFTPEDHRSVLLSLCAMISSTPIELEDAIYRDSFAKGDPFIAEENNWSTIGDCEVQWAGNTYGSWSYRIRPIQ